MLFVRKMHAIDRDRSIQSIDLRQFRYLAPCFETDHVGYRSKATALGSSIPRLVVRNYWFSRIESIDQQSNFAFLAQTEHVWYHSKALGQGN